MNPPPTLGPDDLVPAVRALLTDPGRAMIGITGPPGAGKSRLAGDLAERLTAVGLTAAVVPMDGFHLADPVLDRLGRRDRKGSPDTFDADGYAVLLARLANGHTTVYAPAFHRDREEAVAAELEVGPAVRVVITEGNYLLLATPPWPEARACLRAVWYLDTPEEVRLPRLVRRHVESGRSPEAARAWAYGTDQANARLIAATRHRADAVIGY